MSRAINGRKPIRKRRKGEARRGPADVPPEQWRNPKYLAFLRREGMCKACRVAVWRGKDAPALEPGVAIRCTGRPTGSRRKGQTRRRFPAVDGITRNKQLSGGPHLRPSTDSAGSRKPGCGG